MPASLDTDVLAPLRQRLTAANHAFAAAFPGDSPARQPVHTVYGGAHLFKADTSKKMAQLALRHLDEYGPDARVFAEALGIPSGAAFADTLYARVREKLTREAVEDFRIDFEDGYGNRPDAEEDAQAEIAARETAAGMAAGTLPPFVGIRVKPLTDELAGRAIRTLDLFVTTLCAQTGARLPEPFVVTLPKVTHVAQVETLVHLFELLEARTGLPRGALKMELMIETTQAIFGADGQLAIPLLVRAGQGRVSACHFGTYDYTATCNITAAFQKIDHPACDFATALMQIALAGTGVALSDGATTIMPIPPNRAKAGETLSGDQLAENRRAVHRAWKLVYDNVHHALERGVYQGWDLHPGQLAARYAAIYAFFGESFASASLRLKNFIDAAAKATLVSADMLSTIERKG